MARHEKTRLKVLRGGSDANVGFDDLRGLLLHLGFEEVRQVRAVITRYGLGGEE